MTAEACLIRLAEISESLAFLMPVGPADSDPAPGTTIEVPWHGPDGSRGLVLLALDPGAASAATANMLGLAPDAEPSDDDRRDAICELANVVAGNLLPVYFGGDHEYHLEAPRACAARALTGRPVLRLELVEGSIGVALENEPDNSRILKAVVLPPALRR